MEKEKEHARGRSEKAAQKQICRETSEQDHLFVPSCVAKSLTEAILNDIGESLQSEELLQGVSRRRKRKNVTKKGLENPSVQEGH